MFWEYISNHKPMLAYLVLIPGGFFISNIGSGILHLILILIGLGMITSGVAFIIKEDVRISEKLISLEESISKLEGRKKGIIYPTKKK
ncbi:MAG: hypothetical protein Q8Q35_02215 [Nanoarchaeota archaeon]|nr:hypothetical protein [Nanoarchaeota archaeon]